MTIDLDPVMEVAHLGVRRATLFLGLGVNASESPSLVDYQLPHHTAIKILPGTVDPPKLAEFKEEFGLWIISCGLRELIESFAVFLDQVHDVCLRMAVEKQQQVAASALHSSKQFEMKGLDDKLSVLDKGFGVAPRHPGCLISISQARNCMAHRRGIVGQKDCKGRAKKLRISWWTPELYFESQDGEKVVLELPITSPVVGPAGAKLMMKSGERVRTVSQGSRVGLSPKELQEICFFVKISADEVIEASLAYASKLKITFVPKQPAEHSGDGGEQLAAN